MNRNRFLMLVAVTLVAAVLVAVLGGPRESGESTPEKLLPGLAAVVNELAAVDIVAPGGAVAVSLRRDDQRWRVSQRDGYEADFAQVLELLRTLAGAGIAESRTARPAWYGELGVQDLTEPDATGRRIDFPGREIPSVIIGQGDPSGEGSYARVAGEAQSWLLDAVVEVPVDPVAWLEPSIMDIPSSEIAEVIVRHADGETVRLQTTDDEERSVVLMDVPEGREAGPAFKRNALANGLRGLNLEDVRRFEPPVPDDASRVLFRTVDGLNFVADVFERDDARWIHFTVSAETTPAEPAGDDAGQGDATSGGPAESDESDEPDESGTSGGGDGDKGAADEEQALADAVAVDARLSPWLFEITQRRYDDLTPRMEDLLAPVDDTDEDNGASG